MNRDNLVRELRKAVGDEYVLVEKEDVIVYEQDGSIMQVLPEIVVLPRSTKEVAAVVRAAKQANVAIVPRGSGTGLTGGAVPAEGGVVISLARMNRILELDLRNRFAVVEPGVINQDVTKAVAADGFFYAPDPSSQAACSIGGNIANNSGGPHTLAYGVTTNHVLGVEVVLDDGRVVWLGGQVPDCAGYDLCGAFVGSEGTVGIVTKAVLHLMRSRESVRTLLAIFDRMDAATQTVVDITAAGIVPAALETLDPNYYVQDGVVPRSRLPEIMRQIATISARYHLRIANVFHAGDGNLHPNILFDMRTPGELDKVIAAGEDILRACVAVGGSITGEHGIGLEKKAYIGLLFSDADLNAMAKVRKAFDPDGRFNPAKMFPTPITCAEMRRAPAKIPAGMWI